MLKKILISFIFVNTFLLTGCSFGPVTVDSATTYVIKCVPHVATKKSHGKTIVVMSPESSPLYNTSEMAYTLSPFHIAYFAKNRWADTPARMLQPLIVKTLQDTHHFHAVISAPSFGRYDYMLITQLLRLQQEFSPCCSSRVHMVVRALILSAASGRVIATKEFSVVKLAPQNNPYSGVIATNCATMEILSRLARFVLNTV